MKPNKLKQGDHVRVIAPARSLAIISDETRMTANQTLADFGLSVSFGQHVEEMDMFLSTTVAARVADLHAAFLDKEVNGILTAIGGYSSNQLLSSIDFDVIKQNPKIICGYSDITILLNAIYTMTGLMTYYGPHYSTLGMKLGNEYTKSSFQKCFMQDERYTLAPADKWSDDAWYLDQDKRTFLLNSGYHAINLKETIEGHLIGGNLDTFSLLFGTKYMPSLKGAIVLIEDDEETTKESFDRHLSALILQSDFQDVKALVIGRFQHASHIDAKTLEAILTSKKELSHMPIITNVDFGHTSPIVTLPIGGTMRIKSVNKNVEIEILEH